MIPEPAEGNMLMPATFAYTIPFLLAGGYVNISNQWRCGSKIMGNTGTGPMPIQALLYASFALMKLIFAAFQARAEAAHCALASQANCMALDTVWMRYVSTVLPYAETGSDTHQE